MQNGTKSNIESNFTFQISRFRCSGTFFVKRLAVCLFLALTKKALMSVPKISIPSAVVIHSTVLGILIFGTDVKTH